MSHTSSCTETQITSIAAVKKTIAQLQKQGIKLRLEKNHAPRMYYRDQLQKHLGRKSEVCDYVIVVEDAQYDIALLKDEKTGNYYPVFDDWAPGSSGGIKHVLGAEWNGKVEHWSGNRNNVSEGTLHSIGKFLKELNKQQVLEAARRQGKQARAVERNGKTQIIITG